MSMPSCRKDEVSAAPEYIFDLGADVRINDLAITTDGSWVACGGARDESGYFFRSENDGVNWTVKRSEFNRSIYCIDFLDSLNGVAGGDYLDLWTTTDGGRSWQYKWLDDQVPLHEEDRPGVRNIAMVSDSTWYFCGGENLGEGVVYHTHDAGRQWEFEFLQHEFRAMDVFQNERVIVGGHGAVILIENDVTEYFTTSFKDDFMTSLVCFNEAECVGVGYNGAIYRSSNAGLTWQMTEKSNKPLGERVNWNAIAEHEGIIIAAGNKGMMARSADSGRTWSYLRIKDEPNFYALLLSGDRVLATSDRGKIFQIRWP